jgi:hypothetical protein
VIGTTSTRNRMPSPPIAFLASIRSLAPAREGFRSREYAGSC